MFNKTSATKVIEEHNNNLDTLKQLIDIVRHPEDLLAAHEAARRETALTEEQEKKHKEALEFIAQYEEKSAAHYKEHESLKADQEAHVADVESFRAWRLEEETRLKAIKEEQEIAHRTLIAREKEINDNWKEMQRKYSEAVSPLDERDAQLKKAEAANIKETERLRKLALLLADRVDKLKKIPIEEEEYAASSF